MDKFIVIGCLLGIGCIQAANRRPIAELVIMEKMPIKAIDGKSVVVVCNIKDGNPKIISKVRWYLDRELLKELPECNDEKDAAPLCNVDPHILTLENVNKDFAGNYSCAIKNLAGWGPISPLKELIVQ